MFRMPQTALGIVLLLLVCANAQAQNLPALPVRDFQQWTKVSFTYDVAPKFAVSAFGEVRSGNNVSQFSEELLRGWFRYSPSRFVSFGPGYYYLNGNPFLSGLNHENRFYVQATFKTPRFHGFKITDRFRPELRWLQLPNVLNNKFVVPGTSQAVFAQRYRNRVTVEHPIGVAQAEGFVHWERWYETLTHGWTTTRYYAGFVMPINGWLSTEYYYMYQRDTAFRPNGTQAIGVSFVFDAKSERAHRPLE